VNSIGGYLFDGPEVRFREQVSDNVLMGVLKDRIECRKIHGRSGWYEEKREED
jgi:hypothetical protein